MAGRLLPPRHRLSGGREGKIGRLSLVNSDTKSGWLDFTSVLVAILREVTTLLNCDNCMPDLADLYPGFASHWIDTSAGKIFARAGGSGPPLTLLHGYAQTNVMWHKVADELAKHFALVIPDLPGYGWSAVPDAGLDHAPYTKRAMAAAMIDVMEALGHARFNLAGHD